MKLLYGVQATGNGHISRARAMSRHFASFGIEVDYLFSGRDRKNFFDMEDFGQWRCKRGLSFSTKAGKVRFFSTIFENNILELLKDIRQLDVSGYDAVLTDFEPISAWAAKGSNVPCISMGHQPAFNFDIPKRGESLIPELIMKYFAPSDYALGLHWHHFGHPILPPIAETHSVDEPSDPNKVVVYLGFEESDEVLELLEPFENTLFVYYGPFPEYESRGHVQLKPLSREGFKHDLATASGVICNAGFELSSEAIQLGKKLLVKPLQGQLEQLSNARALEELGLGMSMDSLDPNAVDRWLKDCQAKQVCYPDVAKGIVEWLSQKGWQEEACVEKLAAKLWQKVTAPNDENFAK